MSPTTGRAGGLDRLAIEPLSGFLVREGQDVRDRAGDLVRLSREWPVRSL
jgi:hypothetical protein